MEQYEYLAHHGIKGMKWGVRKYQNEDGSLTPAGKKRYSKNAGKAEKLSSKELVYRAKAAKMKSQAEYWEQRRDKKMARPFQTDISIGAAKKFDRKRAKAAVKARKYEAKADRAANKAERFLDKNEKLLGASVSSAKVSSKTKANVDSFIKQLDSDTGYLKVKDKQGNNAWVNVDSDNAASSLRYLGYSAAEADSILQSVRKR